LPIRCFVSVALAAALALGCAQTPRKKEAIEPAALTPANFDPVTSDPPPGDPAFPAAIEEVAIPSGESYMNGIVYVAHGAGPHPVAILLHGYPGDEKSGDLAHALRRAGWDVLFFHYRGSWGSEGKFSFTHAREDVTSALEFVRTERFAQRFRADPSRIVLVGHSMGGFLALTTGADDAKVSCVASIAGANMGRFGMAAADPARRADLEKALGGWSGPIRGTSGKKLVKELTTNASRWDTTQTAAKLATRPVLLVAGVRDTVTAPPTHHDPVVAAFAAAGSTTTTAVVLDADHAFSDKRVALTRAVVDWLGTDCR
jgi:pimeloyl-ACP methyl ester carboxylesterase